MSTSPPHSDLTASQLEPPPTHHVHHSSDQLPTRSTDLSRSSVGGGPTTEYVADNPELSSRNGDNASTTATVGMDNRARPLDARPAPEGGVARGGNEGLPEGKASITDNLVGKTEKITGKIKKNPEMQETGELRESGGKDAVTGEAREPHD